jgi:hypothetical protein
VRPQTGGRAAARRPDPAPANRARRGAVNAPMAERSPEDALVSHVPSWRVLEARRARARRTRQRLPVVAITIGLHLARVGSATG